jgi:hypothetical protein
MLTASKGSGPKAISLISRNLSTFPQLPLSCESLFASQNPIRSLAGLPTLPSLSRLDLSHTLIQSFAGASPQPVLRMLLLQDSPLGRMAYVAEMALIVLSDELGVVNGFVVSPQQRQFARCHADLLRDDLLGGWVISSVAPLRLLHTKTREQKGVTPPAGGSDAASSPSPMGLSDNAMNHVFKAVVSLSQQWNAQPDVPDQRAAEEMRERMGNQSRISSLTVPSIVRNRKLRRLGPATASIGDLMPSPTDQIRKRPTAERRSPPQKQKEHEVQPPPLAQEFSDSASDVSDGPKKNSEL